MYSESYLTAFGDLGVPEGGQTPAIDTTNRIIQHLSGKDLLLHIGKVDSV